MEEQIDTLDEVSTHSSQSEERRGKEPMQEAPTIRLTEDDLKRIVEQVAASVTQAVIKNVVEPLEARFEELEKLIKLENEMEHLLEGLSDFRKLRKDKRGR
jgi:uncharacterized protein with von Willebrand factor type A (vWA) domain